MAIAYNSTSRINEVAAGSTTLSWAHTCNAADTKLIVAAGGRAAISGITYNGVAMTKISDHASGSYQYNSYYYLDNPGTGSAYNIVVTYSSSATNRSGVATGLSGATTGIGATGTNNQNGFSGQYPSIISSTITTTTNNSHIFIIPSANDAGTDSYIRYGANQTEIYRNNAGAWSFRLQYKTTTTAGAGSSSINNDINGLPNNLMISSFEIKELVLDSSKFFQLF